MRWQKDHEVIRIYCAYQQNMQALAITNRKTQKKIPFLNRMIKHIFFIHIQTSFYYETKLIGLHHAMLLTTISNQEAVATSKSKV